MVPNFCNHQRFGVSLHLKKTTIYPQIPQGHRQIGKMQGGILATLMSQKNGSLLREIPPGALSLPALTAVVDHGV